MRARPTLLLPVLALVAVAGVGAPALAADVVDVQVTQDGPQPQQLRVAPGDSVRFVNTDTFVHRIVSDSANWAFDTRALVPGDSYTVPQALTGAGTYSYRGTGLDRFTGTVVVPGAASPSPVASRRASAPRTPASAPPATSASPSPGTSASPSPSGSPAPVATGGTGSVQGPPPLAGGSFQDLSPAPLPDGPAPQVAPGETPVVADPSASAPDVAPSEATASPATAIGAPPVLASPVGARRYGLPLALAVVLLAGVASLLVRLLLAEAPRTA